VKSVDSEDIAAKLAEEVKLLLVSADFQLTKFSSNSRKMLSIFCHDELVPGCKDLDFAPETNHSKRSIVAGESIV